MPLDKTCRGFLFAHNQLNSLFIEAVACGHLASRCCINVFNRVFNNTVIIFWLALLPQHVGDSLDFTIINKRAMHPHHAAATFHKQHIAAPQKLFGALFAQNRTAINPRGDLKADPGWEIGFDCAGDHVN